MKVFSKEKCEKSIKKACEEVGISYEKWKENNPNGFQWKDECNGLSKEECERLGYEMHESWLVDVED